MQLLRYSITQVEANEYAIRSCMRLGERSMAAIRHKGDYNALELPCVYPRKEDCGTRALRFARSRV